MRRIVTLAAVAALLPVSAAAAQSRQPFSLQGSAAFVSSVSEDADLQNDATRFGAELQARYTMSRWSVGLGLQRSQVYKASASDDESGIEASMDVKLTSIFVEPRFILASYGRVAPYAAGRLGVGRYTLDLEASDPDEEIALSEDSDRAVQFGGGFGLLVALHPRASMDLGAQFFNVGQSDWTDNLNRGNGYYMLRVGVGVGLGR